jgi:hypothetical protein
VSATVEDTVLPKPYFLKKVNIVEINYTSELCISSPSYNKVKQSRYRPGVAQRVSGS